MCINHNYVQLIRIVLYGVLTLILQGGIADQTKVGVCNYRSKSDLLEDAPQDIIHRNVDYYNEIIGKARSENAKIVVFPEGGLTTLAPFYGNRDVYFKYSLNISDWKDACPCDDDIWIKKGLKGAVISKLSCAAKSNQVHVVVNILEKEFIGTSEYSYDIYNTNLVFNNSGHIIVRYRKAIPGVTNRTQDMDISNENEFTVGNGKYKTIIGNDIYKEYINFFKTNDTDNIVWSTASKKNCTDLPALALAQIFETQNKNIYIADYGDDLWSSSCSYYNRNLYTSFGDQSDDHLILVPSDDYVKITRQVLKANCFIKFILNHVNTTSLLAQKDQKKYETCKINYDTNITNKYSSFFIVTTKDRKEISLCGIAAVGEDSHVTDNGRFNNLAIKWDYERPDCTKRREYYIPITAGTRYWPLQIGKYIYKPGPPGELSLNNAEFAIFALMRVRDIHDNCTERSENIASSSMSGSMTKIVVVIVVVVVITVMVIGLGWYFKKRKDNSNSNSNYDSTKEHQNPILLTSMNT